MKFFHRVLGALLVTALAAAVAAPALAQKSKVQKSEGKFVEFDPENSTITVKQKGQNVVYNVKPEGSVLTRTTVSMNAAPATVPDIPPGAPVIVYWMPDESDKKKKFARKIDAPKVPEELLDQYE